MELRKYSVIVFDLGNVLIPFNYDLIIDNLNKIEESLGTKFYEFYQDNYNIHRSFERGDITEDEFIVKMLDACDNKINKEQFCTIFSGIFTVNEDVAALLPELKKKYTLILLSNTNSVHREYGWKQYSFLKYFDKLFLSHEVGALKPEPAIYKAVTDYTGKPPREHIFIDDVAEYIEGAKKAGWDGIQFKNYKQLRSELELRKII